MPIGSCWLNPAAVGMATKYAEIGLGVKYRKKMPDGSFAGGPMYYLAEGLHAPWLGKIVAVLFLFFSIAISAVVDTNTMTGDRNESFGVNPIVAGASVLTVMRYGMARGIFSNEVGIGSVAVTCASAAIKEPAEQAIWGPFEVFADTGIVCMIFDLTIVLSGLWDTSLDGVALTMNALRTMLSGNRG